MFLSVAFQLIGCTLSIRDLDDALVHLTSSLKNLENDSTSNKCANQRKCEMQNDYKNPNNIVLHIDRNENTDLKILMTSTKTSKYNRTLKEIKDNAVKTDCTLVTDFFVAN